MAVSLMSSEILDQVVDIHDIIAVAEVLDVPAPQEFVRDRVWTARWSTLTLALPYRTFGGSRRRNASAEKPRTMSPARRPSRDSPSLPRRSPSVQSEAVVMSPGHE